MHHPERLHAAITHVSILANASPLASPQRFFPVFTALLSAQFCPIFRKLECRSPPTRCLSQLAQSFCPALTTHAWSCSGDSPVQQNPKWNENALSESRARTGRLRDEERRQDKASCLAAGTSFLSFCLHVVFAGLALCPVRCGGGAADTLFFVFNDPSGITCDVLGVKDRIAYAEASNSTLLCDERASAIAGCV
jgi:hypothetical protein